MLCQDFGLVDKKSKFCKQSDLDTMFISIDACAARLHAQHLKDEEELLKNAHRMASKEAIRASGTRTAKYEDKRQKFSRVEFMASLITISIKK